MNDIIVIILTFLSMIYLVVKSRKAMHMLQQNLYNENNRYIKWMKNNMNFVFPVLDILIFIVIGVWYLLNRKLDYLFYILEIILISISIFVIRNKEKKEQVKKPLVITARVKRLIVTLTVLYLIPLVIGVLNNKYTRIMFTIYMFMIFINYFVMLIAKVINIPVEKLVYLKYYNMASKKLKNSNINVIGITGSYGKTSSKNILSDILNVKYITKPTPKNLNTEYGLMITINNHLDKFDQILIAEMGAYKKGEIKTLCDMVHPKYGILTKVGTAHLETFGSQENIQKTKFELIESLPDDGVAVLNMDDELQVNYEIKSKCKKLWIGIDNVNADVYASNIKCDYNGSTFDVSFKGDKNIYTFTTKLLGKNNIYNILASITLGKELGMSIDDLILGVRKAKQVEHRLELKRIGNFYMIDDAYNSNPVGAKGALEVLNMMNGDKVIVTPGMIELGEKQYELNYEFGRQIATISGCKYVILIGEKITKPIYEGIKDAGFNLDNVIIENDVKKAYPIISSLKGDKDMYALFENDLPDSYNE